MLLGHSPIFWCKKLKIACPDPIIERIGKITRKQENETIENLEKIKAERNIQRINSNPFLPMLNIEKQLDGENKNSLLESSRRDSFRILFKLDKEILNKK